MSVLARIAAANPRINALAFVLADEALASADRADGAVRDGAPLGDLHGIPATTKINVDQAGWPTTEGLPLHAGTVAAEDSPPVASLKASGAILVGRSNSPAFGLRWFTDNDLHGRTLNPWDPAVTPGGSSGGAAAAVATGMGAIGHGNDLGGSIRYPAYCCGVVGLRPTVGRVAAFNPTAKAGRGIASQLMTVNGPLARTVADCRLALKAMARPDARDPTWVPAPLDGPPIAEPMRVALVRSTGTVPVDPAVSIALDEAARCLERAGFLVEETVLPHFDEAVALWRSLVHDDLRRGARAAIVEHGDRPARVNIEFMFAGMSELDRDGYLAALARRLAIARAWSVLFEHCPTLLMPVSLRRPVPIDEDAVDADRFEALVAAQGPLVVPAMLGLPALSVPTGLTDGIPMGVQLVAGRFREDLCLRAGAAIEQACGRFVPDEGSWCA